MTTGSFRGKPTKSHIVWGRQTHNGPTKKTVDCDRFEKWATHCGFDSEQATRVDHDHEPRIQYRCILKCGRIEGETMDLGDEKWSLGGQKTP